MSREKIDWSTFSDDMGALDLFGTTLRRSMGYDSYTARTRFKARALTDMFELSTSEVMAIDGGSTGGNGSARYGFKARIIGENSPHSFIPDPCDPSLLIDENATYRQIALHTTFLSNTADSGENVTRGDIVVVEVDRSDHSYDLEYGRFVSVSSHEAPTSGSATAECSSLVNLVGNWGGPTNHVGSAQTIAPVGKDGASGPVPYTQTQCSFAAVPRPTIPSLSYREWGIIYQALKPLFDFIGAKEGGYDSCNRGNAGDTPRSKCKTMFGKPISEMTVGEIKGLQAARRVMAVGKMQWIPSTFKSSTRAAGISDSTVFSPTVQNAVGAYLMMGRRKWLGGYILGIHDQECLAAFEIAFEWASLPMPAPGAWLDGKYNSLRTSKKYNMQTVPRGSTAYMNLRAGKNAAHRSAEEVAAAINNARNSIRANPEAVALLATKGITIG